MQFYFQLSPYFISLFGRGVKRENTVPGGTADQDSDGQGEWPSWTSCVHMGPEAQPKARLQAFPMALTSGDPPPQRGSGQTEGSLASLPYLVSTCHYEMQKKEICLTPRTESPSSSDSYTLHSPQQSHLLSHSKVSRWGPRHSSECLFERRLIARRAFQRGTW